MERQDEGEKRNNFRGRTWGAELENEPGCWNIGIFYLLEYFRGKLSFQARQVHTLWPFSEIGPQRLADHTAFSGVAAACVHRLICIQTPELGNREPWSYSSMKLLIQKLTKTTLTSRQLVIRCSFKAAFTHGLKLWFPWKCLPPGCLYGCVWLLFPLFSPSSPHSFLIILSPCWHRPTWHMELVL